MASKKLSSPAAGATVGAAVGINASNAVAQSGVENVSDTNVLSEEELREREVAYKHDMIDVQNGIDTNVLNTGTLSEKREFTEKVMEASLYGKQLAQVNGTAYDVPDMFPDVNGNMTVGIQSYEPTDNAMTMTQGSKNLFIRDADKRLSRDEQSLTSTMQSVSSKQLEGTSVANKQKLDVSNTLDNVGKTLSKSSVAKGAAIGAAAGTVLPGFGAAVGMGMGTAVGAVAPVVSKFAKDVTSRVKQTQVSNEPSTKASRIAQAEALSNSVQGGSSVEKDDSFGMV